MTAPTQSDDRSTPGKPNDEASRQQKHPNQGTQTGSEELDRKTGGPGGKGGPAGPRPPNAK
jgi:hypothetical protein